MQPQPPLELFYDGQCPLCLKEVGWLARRASPGRLVLVDLHSVDQRAGLPGHAELMATLHARDGHGRWYQGVEATLAAWQMAGVGWRLAWLRLPGVAWIARRLYRWFARHRLRLGQLVGESICDEDCRVRAAGHVRSQHQGATGPHQQPTSGCSPGQKVN